MQRDTTEHLIWAEIVPVARGRTSTGSPDHQLDFFSIVSAHAGAQDRAPGTTQKGGLLMYLFGSIRMAALATALLTSVAPAHPQGPGDALGPCREDFRKFCSGVKPGGGRAGACLRQHTAQLSQGCSEFGRQRRERERMFSGKRAR